MAGLDNDTEESKLLLQNILEAVEKFFRVLLQLYLEGYLWMGPSYN